MFYKLFVQNAGAAREREWDATGLRPLPPDIASWLTPPSAAWLEASQQASLRTQDTTNWVGTTNGVGAAGALHIRGGGPTNPDDIDTAVDAVVVA